MAQGQKEAAYCPGRREYSWEGGSKTSSSHPQGT